MDEMNHDQIASNSSNSNRQVDLRTGRERLPHASHFKSEPKDYQWDLDDSDVQEVGAVLLGSDVNKSSLEEEEDIEEEKEEEEEEELVEELVEEQEQEDEHAAPERAPERVDDASEASGLGAASFELLLQQQPHHITPMEQKKYEQDLKFIKKSEYAVIYLGTIDYNRKIDYRIMRRGRLTPDEKHLFDQFNTICQYPECKDHADTLALTTKSKYAGVLLHYILFLALKGFTEVVVDGVFMREFVQDKVEDSEEGSGLKTLIYHLQYALSMYSVYKKVYDSRNITDELLKAQARKLEVKIPNMDAFKTYLKSYEIKHLRNRSNTGIVEKQRATNISKNYNDENLQKMMVKALDDTGLPDKGKRYRAFNRILEMLLGHHLLLRGDNKRMLELSDLSTRSVKTSRGTINILHVLIMQEKTLKNPNSFRSVGCCRSKNVELCLVGSLARSLYERFDTVQGQLYYKNDKFPDFTDPSAWYRYKMLYSISSGLKSRVSYKFERDLVMECLDSIDFASTKKTHLLRGSQARAADAHGISEEQIRRAGHWEHSVLVQSYLTSFPVDFSMFTAGFMDTEYYYLPREQVKPPESLKKKVYPWLEEVEKQYEESETTDVTLESFFDLLRWFREVFLQDLVYLVDVSSVSFFAKCAIAKDPEFLVFRKKMLEAVDKNKELDNIQGMEVFQRISPILGKQLDMIRSQQKSLDMKIEQLRLQHESTLKELTHDIRHLLTTIMAYTNLPRNVVAAMERPSRPKRRLAGSIETRAALRKIQKTLAEAIAEDLAREIEAATREHIEKEMERLRQQQEAIARENEEVTRAAARLADGKPLQVVRIKDYVEAYSHYTTTETAVNDIPMSTKVTTVDGLFDEWYIDTPTQMCIAARIARYGFTWRRSKNAKSFYLRRVKLIELIQKLETLPAFELIGSRDIATIVEKYRCEIGSGLVALNEKCRTEQDKVIAEIVDSGTFL